MVNENHLFHENHIRLLIKTVHFTKIILDSQERSFTPRKTKQIYIYQPPSSLE